MAAETTPTTPTTQEPAGSEPSRRGVIRGVALGGLTLPVLAACGDDDPATEPTGDDPPAPDDGGDDGSGGGGPEALASTSDVPVGGGFINQEAQVVVTQPTEGEFKAFTAVCTHQQCVVSSVEEGTIECGCHGSMYSAEDGTVQGGPAPSPLEEIAVEVDGDQVVRA